MDEADRKDLGEASDLRLIDVSFEDDCLLESLSQQQDQLPEHLEEHKDFQSFNAVGVGKANALGQTEQPPQRSESVEPVRGTRFGKCNLRKSLAWDSAFFTSAGVLDPDELSSMLGGAKSSVKHSLPEIQEDLRQSIESISTLASDNLTLESIEANLFEDIRASIQKSGSALYSNSKPKSGQAETKNITSKKLEGSSHNMIKAKPGIQGSGKTIKQGGVGQQATQTTAKKRDSSVPKPPEIVVRVNPVSAGLAKKVSLTNRHSKVESDNAKAVGRVAPVSKTLASNASHTRGVTAAGRGAQVSKMVRGLSNPHNSAPGHRLSAASSSAGSLTKRDSITSHSSVNSSSSASSNSISKSPLNAQKRKTDAKSINLPSSGSLLKTATRTSIRHKSQSGTSNLSTCLKSMPKSSSSISPASSISEWSSESFSSTSTANHCSSNSKTSFDSSSPSRDDEATQAFDCFRTSNEQPPDGCRNVASNLPSQSEKRTAEKGLPPCLVLAKPSGLRRPSPKIGFFDGVKPATRTSRGDGQYDIGLPTGLPKRSAGLSSPCGSLSRTKLIKLQSARTGICNRNVKIDTQGSVLNVKSSLLALVHNQPAALKKLIGASRNAESNGLTSDCSGTKGSQPDKHVLESDLGVDGRDCGDDLNNKTAPPNPSTRLFGDLQETAVDKQSVLLATDKFSGNLISLETQNDHYFKVEQEHQLRGKTSDIQGSATPYVLDNNLNAAGKDLECRSQNQTVQLEAVQNTGIDTEERKVDMESKSVTPAHYAPPTSTKTHNATKNADNCSINSKVHDNDFIKIGSKSQLKSEGSGNERLYATSAVLDCGLNGEESYEDKSEKRTEKLGYSHHEDIQVAHSNACGLGSDYNNYQITKATQINNEDANLGQCSPIHSFPLFKTNEKDAHFLNETEGLCGVVQAMDLHSTADGLCCGLSSAHNIQIIKASQINYEDANLAQHPPKKNLPSPCQTNAHFSDEIEGLCGLVQEMDLNIGQKSGSVNTLSKLACITLSPTTGKTKCYTRTPLGAKNSLGNDGEELDLPKPVEETEKPAVLPAIEGAEKENN